MIKKLIKEELKRAREKFPKFHSSHEGFAVILEEIEEMESEFKVLNKHNEELWEDVKLNDTFNQRQLIQSMRTDIFNLIKEAIQVAAMIEKFDQDIK